MTDKCLHTTRTRTGRNNNDRELMKGAYYFETQYLTVVALRLAAVH
jgi:hypothetical protein